MSTDPLRPLESVLIAIALVLAIAVLIGIHARVPMLDRPMDEMEMGVVP